MTDLTRWWPLPDLTEIRDALLTAWSSPGRGYHDPTHLTEVLTHLDLLLRDVPAGAVDPVALRLAAWFHDAVYEGQRDDEERSALWAAEALAGRPTLAAEVARLVRLTEHHRPEPDDVSGALLCDADLAILAAGPERYAAYVAGVRQEYADLDDATFAAGRASVLRQLVDTEHLYATARARALWEEAARANVRAELVTLETAASGDAARPGAGG